LVESMIRKGKSYKISFDKTEGKGLILCVEIILNRVLRKNIYSGVERTCLDQQGDKQSNYEIAVGSLRVSVQGARFLFNHIRTLLGSETCYDSWC
jgi:hypothetical protein